MTFGRLNNMRRRAVRPDGSFHRSKRRRGKDRVTLLDDPRMFTGGAGGGTGGGIVAALRRFITGR